MRFFKVILICLAGVGLLYVALCAAIYTAMRQPPERFGAIMTKVPDVAFLILPFESLWMSARAGQLRVGDAAPDFDLAALDRSRSVKLSSEYPVEPVVLIFGSYT
ncbi:hypothetical protein [Nevskia soli]|uniref:hypothetical protein n=1 Tax=Nevskia soli TaxID=418856 RepID=UPI0015D71AE0|nr:hypothetical protein [Nevskia soli]